MAKPGRTSFSQRFASFVEMLRYYARFTYAGAPSRASAEAGREVLARLGKQSADILSEVWTGKIPPSEAHSPVWPYRSIFLSETIERVSERLAGVVNPIW